MQRTTVDILEKIAIVIVLLCLVIIIYCLLDYIIPVLAVCLLSYAIANGDTDAKIISIVGLIVLAVIIYLNTPF